MVQLAILAAGLVILAASVLIAALGRIKTTKIVSVFERESVNLGQTDNINERRLPFAVPTDSEADFTIAADTGRFEIGVSEFPVSIPPEANVGWNLPTLYRDVLGKSTTFTRKLKPGTYAIVLMNEQSVPSMASVSLVLRSPEETYPKLYEVGIQILVVAVPLIVAGLVS